MDSCQNCSNARRFNNFPCNSCIRRLSSIGHAFCIGTSGRPSNYVESLHDNYSDYTLTDVGYFSCKDCIHDIFIPNNSRICLTCSRNENADVKYYNELLIGTSQSVGFEEKDYYQSKYLYQTQTPANNGISGYQQNTAGKWPYQQFPTYASISEGSSNKDPNNDFIKYENLLNKIAFWDIDGTLAAYRFKGHIVDQQGNPDINFEDAINKGLFYDRPPSKFMQRVLRFVPTEKNIVISHCCNDKEKADKIKWLNKHFPMISDYLIISYPESKADTIIKYCKINNIELSDVIFIDDVVRFLGEADRKGIESWHISSFLDIFE